MVQVALARIQCDKRDGSRLATFSRFRERKEKLWKLSEELNENQVWNNDGDWPSLYDSLGAGRSLDDNKKILSPPKAAQIDDLSRTIQAWENLAQLHRERTGDQLPEDKRLAILLSMCPTDLEIGVDSTATFCSRIMHK